MRKPVRLDGHGRGWLSWPAREDNSPQPARMQLVGSAEAMEAYSRIKKFMTSDELENFTNLIQMTE